MSRLPSKFTRAHLDAGLGSRALGKRIFDILNLVLPLADLAHVAEDFLGRPGAALPTWLTTQDTSVAGSPVLDFGTDAAGGTFVLWLAVDAEVEAITLYGGDNLSFDLDKDPIFKCRVKIESDVTGAGGLFAAGDKLVVGLASNRDATLDNVATHAWFRFEGANHNILVETDDGVTDNDDNDTTIDWAENAYIELEIDARNKSSVRFKINGVDRTPETMSLAAATGNLQVFIELQKAAALNFNHRVTVDWIDVSAER